VLACRRTSGHQALKPPFPRAGPQGRGANAFPPRRVPWLRAMLRDRRGVTAVEYAVISGILIGIVISASGPFYSGLAALLTHVSDGL